MPFIELKDKWSHAKKLYLSENLFESGNTKPEVVRSTLQTEAGDKISIEKMQKQIKTII